MNRRKFLGALAGGTVASLSGCIGNRYPTGFLYGLLPKNRNSIEEIRNNILSEGVPADNIYLNDFMNTIQLSGEYKTLDKLTGDLDLRTYRLYSTREEIPLIPDSSANSLDIKREDIQEFKELSNLVNQTNSQKSSVGMIDTNADWNAWYDNQKLNHKIVAQNMNPIIGPFLGDKDHGEYTAKTLFHSQQNVSSDGPHIRGLISNSEAYHAEISAVVTVSQFFRSLCDSLEWMAKNNVDIITMPLSTITGDDSVLSSILEEFVTELSTSIIVVSAGNVDVCNGDINALANSDIKEIVGVGSIEPTEDIDISGRHELVDILGPTNFKIDSNMTYSGTSASTTVIAGVLELYISTLKEKYPNHSRSQYREYALTGLLEEASDVQFTRCNQDITLSQGRYIKGLTRALYEADQT